MTRRRRRPGRQLLLTEEVEKRLVDAARAGVPVDIAASHAGIGAATFHLWMGKGRAEQERRDDGEDPDEDRDPYVDLLDKVTRARSEAAVKGVLNVQRAAAGGAVTEETTRKWRDPETGAPVEERTVKRMAPDWRAAAWYLERQHRLHFGKEARLELTGAGGGPVEVSVDADALAARLHENLRAVGAAVAELTSGDDPGDDMGEEPVDAEIVDDDEQTRH